MKLVGYGLQFIASKFEGGAGYDQVGMRSSEEFMVGWTVTVKTAPGAQVTVVDAAGAEAFKGVADAEGKAAAELMQYSQSGSQRTPLTPHKVTVSKDGSTKTATVTADAKKEFELGL